jgi:hypothetical protein
VVVRGSRRTRDRGNEPLSFAERIFVAIGCASDEVTTPVLAADHALGCKFHQDEPDRRAARTQLLRELPFRWQAPHLAREVGLTVLRPPTFDALRQAVKQAADAGEPFHVVHFDGHGVMPSRLVGGGAIIGGRQAMMTGPVAEGMLAFEQPGGGSDDVTASKVAAVLAEGGCRWWC